MLLFHQDLGEGIPIVILHGLFGSLDNWRTVSLKFAENYRVIPVDLRNHGRSFHKEDHTYDLMAGDLLRLLDYLGLEKIILIGHSMGGKAGMYFALNYQERVSKLIVVDMAPRAYESSHNLVIEALNSVNLSEVNSRNQVDLKLQSYITDTGTRQFLMKGLYRNEGENFAWRFNLKTLTEKYDQINVGLPEGLTFHGPVLFMKGEFSNYITDSDTIDIVGFFPTGQLVTIPKSGHWIHADAPSAFVATVLDFID